MWCSLLTLTALLAVSWQVQAQGRRFCSSTLADMLSLVCGGRFYSGTDKRAQNGLTLPRIMESARRKRSVVEACCHRGCSLEEMESYCEEGSSWRNLEALIENPTQESKSTADGAGKIMSVSRSPMIASSRQVYDMFKNSKPFFFLVPQVKRSESPKTLEAQSEKDAMAATRMKRATKMP